MAHRKWKESKLQPGTAGPGNMLVCCLVSFHFLWAILCPQAVHICFIPPVKVWPIDLLHADDVGVEVETPANVAHHDSDVVRLDWIIQLSELQ